ncbi:hypothetical protein KUTeg_010366 [Tegillarca granosa]|uniref:Major facilitator superfamily (MFS) profile domain-containing protein n=1 Tax=Tegillarca granosa TaxID=220873 RepID=A0ABQ9F6L3_TEGGR|nr:hypothetical protein KUTeg_010366 [Tegillarca granosa]
METLIGDFATGGGRNTGGHQRVKYTKLTDDEDHSDDFDDDDKDLVMIYIYTNFDTPIPNVATASILTGPLQLLPDFIYMRQHIELEAVDLELKDSTGTSSDEDTTPGAPPCKRFTVEEAVESVGFGFFQILLFIQCGLFTAADALEMMLLAVLSPVLRCEWGLDHYHVAFITTVVFVGMCFMAPVWGLMGDKFGRQKTLTLVTFWIGYFGLLTAFSPSFTWILILRCLVGGGLAGSPQSFALLTEYLPSRYRAKMLNLTQISWASGTMFEITIAALVIPTLGWRWLLVLSAVPSFIIIITLKFLPESARYLVAADRKKDAIKILEKAAKINKTSLPEGTLKHSRSIKRGEPRDLFSSQYLRTTLQLWLLWFVTAFSYYGMVLATLPLNLLLVDLVGRRWTGAVNLGGCALFFILLQLDVPQKVLTFFMFVVRGFSSGMFNFVYIYTAEVYPTTIRTLGIGVSSSFARVGAMITPFVAQVLLDTSLTAAVWVYGCGCIAAAICAVMLPIETKGRELPWGGGGMGSTLIPLAINDVIGSDLTEL